MSDAEFLSRIAALWIELGGDSEGVDWMWLKLKDEIMRQLTADSASGARNEK